jgi:Kdo2-lipid IVA lauroyltransferase/acyltransferase
MDACAALAAGTRIPRALSLRPSAGNLHHMAAENHLVEPPPLAGMSWAELRDLGLYRLLRSLPVSAVSNIGAALGQIMGRRAHPAADARVIAAIRHLRSDLAADHSALEAAQTRLWANVGRVYAEFCVLHEIVPERVAIDDPGTLDAVLADGRSVIVTFVHLGNWETCASQLFHRAPGRVCALSNPLPRNRVRAQIAAAQHARLPGTVLTIDGTVWRRAVHHLEQAGRILFVAADEHAEGRVSAPSCGRELDPRVNLHKIVRIASRTGAIVLPVYSERLGGARFVTHVLKPREFPRKLKMSPEEQLRHVAHLDALYAPAVLRLIDQWFGLLEFGR